MNIQTENANQFESREECLKWIDERIVRFKLRMTKVMTNTPGEFTYAPQKEQGKIMSTLAEGFKKSGTDEPLSNYASPIKKGGKWLAVMKLSE